jgi:hypothetical protein
MRPAAATAAAALLFVTSLTLDARAGNEEPFLFGDQAALTGGAVVASIRDTAAIWYNPAGLGQNERGRLEISGTAFTLRWRPIPNGLAFDLPSGRVQQAISSHEIYVVPSALAAVREVGHGVSIGVGLFVTEEDLTDYESNFHAHDATVSLDTAGALTGKLVRYHAGPAIGWQITPRLRVGATLFGVAENQHEFRKLFADATMTGGAYQSTFLQRLVDASALRLGFEMLAGVQYDAGDGWQLGFSARSPRWIAWESATTDNSTALISKSATAPTIAVSQVDHTPIGAEGTGFTRAPRFTGGVAKRWRVLELSAELELRPAGIGPVADRTVINARTGLLWFATERTLLGLGFFTDRTGAAPPTTFPDARVDYYGFALGWKHLNSVHLQTGEDASTLNFSTTIALRYAFGVGESTRIRFDFRHAADDGLVDRIADERVDVLYHELSLYLGTGLEF